MQIDRDDPAPLLTIVTGFHNSRLKSSRLLQRLRSLPDPDVDCVLVDDGSTDGTVELLREHQRQMHGRCTVVEQDNRGPGGGRNTGLRHATGKYVWFIDADDDFSPAAVDVVRQQACEDYDFIDFGIERYEDAAGPVRPSAGARVGELEVAVGEHTAAAVGRLFLLRRIGWLVTKVFRRDFLIEQGVAYPEFCVYEDTYLFFLLPFLVRRFYKSDVVGYFHHQDRESVTRSLGRKGDRFYDRLAVTCASLDRAMCFPVDAAEQARLKDKFDNIFLVHTVEMLLRSRDLAMIPRVMRMYREETRARKLRPIGWKELQRRIGRSVLPAWYASLAYPSQRAHFEQRHLRAWGRPIVYPVRAGATAG